MALLSVTLEGAGGGGETIMDGGKEEYRTKMLTIYPGIMAILLLYLSYSSTARTSTFHSSSWIMRTIANCKKWEQQVEQHIYHFMQREQSRA